MKNIKKLILLILLISICFKLHSMEQEDVQMQDVQMQIVPINNNSSSSANTTPMEMKYKNTPKSTLQVPNEPVLAQNLLPTEIWLIIMELIMQQKGLPTFWQDRENKRDLISIAKSCRYLLNLVLQHYNKDLHILVSPLILKLSPLDVLKIINETIKQKCITKKEIESMCYKRYRCTHHEPHPVYF